MRYDSFYYAGGLDRGGPQFAEDYEPDVYVDAWPHLIRESSLQGQHLRAAFKRTYPSWSAARMGCDADFLCNRRRLEGLLAASDAIAIFKLHILRQEKLVEDAVLEIVAGDFYDVWVCSSSVENTSNAWDIVGDGWSYGSASGDGGSASRDDGDAWGSGSGSGDGNGWGDGWGDGNDWDVRTIPRAGWTRAGWGWGGANGGWGWGPPPAPPLLILNYAPLVASHRSPSQSHRPRKLRRRRCTLDSL
ncbi:hypothetical protein DFH09DRAFT_1346952 [Mycena vulgaris]|nr:hypothetical protein DFH09DRAFT_1346952 [Mycena vulgaris]